MCSLFAQQDATVAARFSGIDGFLGTRGSLMLDFVFLAMFFVLPLLGVSVYLVKYRRMFAWHKRMQIALGTVLLIAVLAFEVDMQLMTDWESRAEPSPYFDPQQKWSCPVGVCLLVHLCFAVPTAALWIWVVVQALRKFPNPPVPGSHSRSHRTWSIAATIGMLLTALTGWVFYALAFVVEKG